MSNYEISKSSLLSLKAEILRKQQELVKAKVDNEAKIKVIKKNTPLEIKNKGIEARKNNDITEEEKDLLKQSKVALEAKVKLYDKLSSGKLSKEEIECKKRYLVRFDKKSNVGIHNEASENFEDSEPDEYPESEGDYYHSDEEVSKNPGEKWVDYTDCLGRTRKCLQKDLEYLKSKDEELRKTIEVRDMNKLENRIEEPGDTKNINDNNENIDKTSKENSNENKLDEQSELLSSDMRRELLRQQWEKEEEELRDKSNIHYQDILFGEARTHGVGYYGFSKDEDERIKQQDALKKLRDETEAKQKRAQELKAIREKQLAARIKAAKDRKRSRLGLPPEPEVVEPETEASTKLSEEEKKKQEEMKRQEEEKETLLEEARRKHLRPWDIGKEGVKVHYEMSQEEWVEKKREERPKEFAPPQNFERREFRSTVEDFSERDTDKSLKFTTKKSKDSKDSNKSRRTPKSLMKDNIYQESEKADFAKGEFSNVLGSSQNTNSNWTEFDDRLTEDCSKTIIGIETCGPNQLSSDDRNGDSGRRRGAEIAPPTTFDYYGPSYSKRSKTTNPTINIQSSIDAGLKFLRKQVEEKQKSTRHYSDYTSPC